MYYTALAVTLVLVWILSLATFRKLLTGIGFTDQLGEIRDYLLGASV